MNINDCCDYGYIKDLTFESSEEWVAKEHITYKTYTYAGLKKVYYWDDEDERKFEESFKNFFLFRLFPYLPDVEDCRYEIIRKYTSSNSEFGIERNRCIAFELAVRNKKNVEDIEKAIAYYSEYNDIFTELLYNIEQYGREHILTSSSDEFKLMQKHMYELCSFVKNLKLIPYKKYLRADMLSHWGFDSLIYEIVNFSFYYENGGIYTYHKRVIKEEEEEEEEEETLTYTSKSIGLAKINDESKERVLMLNNVTVLHQKYSPPKGFRGSLTDGTAVFKGLDGDEFKSESQSLPIINNKIFHAFQYPQLETYSKITIEIELSSFKTNINKFLVDAIASLDTIDPKYSSENSLLNITTNTDETQYDIKFFIYDYFTYRLEQNKCFLQCESWDHEQDSVEEAANNIKSDEPYEQKVIRFNRLHKLTKEAIYQELAAILKLKPATVKSYLLEISKKIETSI